MPHARIICLQKQSCCCIGSDSSRLLLHCCFAARGENHVVLEDRCRLPTSAELACSGPAALGSSLSSLYPCQSLPCAQHRRNHPKTQESLHCSQLPWPSYSWASVSAFPLRRLCLLPSQIAAAYTLFASHVRTNERAALQAVVSCFIHLEVQLC